MTAPAQPSNTLILGAGIIGVSTAYYLSREPSNTHAQSIHLIDPCKPLFTSASGYAAGFLAKDWFAAEVAGLGALSFELHQQLAAAHNGRERWGYCPSIGTSVQRVEPARKRAIGKGGFDRSEDERLAQGGSRAALARGGKPEGDQIGAPAWLRKRDGYQVDVISGTETTAQCDPLRLSKFLLEECVQRGVHVHTSARAASASRDLRGDLATVRVVHDDGKETDIPCSRLVITAGAWTPGVFATLFPESKLTLPITSLSGHSLVVKSPRWSQEDEAGGCHAVFATNESGFSPEIFSRIGGEIYVAGLNNARLPLPKLPTDSKPGEVEMRKLKEVAETLLGLGPDRDDLETLREGLCFRPVTDTGRPPIISRVKDEQLGGEFSTRGGGDGGVFVSAGHGPWGIAQSLGTGKVLAEMIEGKPTSADVGCLSL